jgi:hypothetical protein
MDYAITTLVIAVTATGVGIGGTIMFKKHRLNPTVSSVNHSTQKDDEEVYERKGSIPESKSGKDAPSSTNSNNGESNDKDAKNIKPGNKEQIDNTVTVPKPDEPEAQKTPEELERDILNEFMRTKNKIVSDIKKGYEWVQTIALINTFLGKARGFIKSTSDPIKSQERIQYIENLLYYILQAYTSKLISIRSPGATYASQSNTTEIKFISDLLSTKTYSHIPKDSSFPDITLSSFKLAYDKP